MAIQMNMLADETIARMLLDAGFTGESAVVAFAIIIAESGGNAWAINLNTHDPDSDSYLSLDKGICQWNDYWWDIAKGPEAFDPEVSIRKMFEVSKQGTDYSAWNAYDNFTFVRHVSRAYTAFESL